MAQRASPPGSSVTDACCIGSLCQRTSQRSGVSSQPSRRAAPWWATAFGCRARGAHPKSPMRVRHQGPTTQTSPPTGGRGLGPAMATAQWFRGFVGNGRERIGARSGPKRPPGGQRKAAERQRGQRSVETSQAMPERTRNPSGRSRHCQNGRETPPAGAGTAEAATPTMRAGTGTKDQQRRRRPGLLLAAEVALCDSAAGLSPRLQRDRRLLHRRAQRTAQRSVSSSQTSKWASWPASPSPTAPVTRASAAHTSSTPQAGAEPSSTTTAERTPGGRGSGIRPPAYTCSTGDATAIRSLTQLHTRSRESWGVRPRRGRRSAPARRPPRWRGGGGGGGDRLAA